MVVTNAEGESAEGPMHINVTVSPKTVTNSSIHHLTFYYLLFALLFPYLGFDVRICWTRTCVTKFEDAID